MVERDFENNPYSKDEERVAKWLCERGVGGGNDPIGFILTAHEYAMQENKNLKEALANSWK